MSATILLVGTLLGTTETKVALGMVHVRRRLEPGSIRAIAQHPWCALSLKGWVVKIPTIPRQLQIHRSSLAHLACDVHAKQRAFPPANLLPSARLLPTVHTAMHVHDVCSTSTNVVVPLPTSALTKAQGSLTMRREFFLDGSTKDRRRSERKSTTNCS